MSLSNVELIYSQIISSPPKSTIERNEIKKLLSSQNRHGASSVKTRQYEYENNNNDPISSIVVGELQTLANYSSHSTNRLPEINRIFNKMLLFFSASKTVGDDEKHHLDLCNKILLKLSDSIVEDVTSFLVGSLNFVSAASSSSSRIRNAKNRASSKTSWFSVVVDEILPYLADYEEEEEEAAGVADDDDDDGEDQEFVPLSLKRRLESSDFWKELSANIQCLNRISKITLRLFSSSSSLIDFKQQTIEKIAQALLLRVDYHFNNNNRSSDDIEPSPFATRPEHVLQYIGSQWLLLQFLIRKLESSSSSTSTSTNMNFYDSLTNYYSTEVGKIFNSICVSPIIISAHLQNLGGDAASVVASFNFLGDASFLKKMSSKLSSSSESKTSSSPQRQHQQQSNKEEQMIMKQLSNLKLLHLFNTFSEFVSQMEDIFEENFTVTTGSRRNVVTGGGESASNNPNLPCVTSSICCCSGNDDDDNDNKQNKNSTILVFSIITAIQDYCVRALSELNQSASISQDFSDDDDDDDDVHNNKLLQQIETTREKLERMRSKSQSDRTKNERETENLLELLLTTASSSSSRSFYLSNFGQLQCPHYAVTCSDFALSLVGQHLPLLRLTPSSSSSFSLFTKLFFQKVLREVILGFFASKISSSIEKSVSLALGIGYRTRDVLLSLSESNTKINNCKSISNLILLQYFAALLVRVVVPLLEIEETFCVVLPDMLCQKNKEEEEENDDEQQEEEFARHVLVDPLQKFIQSTRQTISSTGVIKKIVSAAMTTNKNNNNMKNKPNSDDSDKNSDDMKNDEDSNDDDDDDEKQDEKEAFIEEYKTIVWNLKLHFEQVLLCFVNGNENEDVSNSSPALFSFFQNSSKTIVKAWEMVFGSGSKMTPRIEATVTKMRDREQQEQEENKKREAEEKRKVNNNIDGEFLDDQIQKGQSMSNSKPTTGILEKFADHLEDHHVPNQEIVSKTTETTKETEAERQEQHQQRPNSTDEKSPIKKDQTERNSSGDDEEREDQTGTPLTPFDFTSSKKNKSAKEINDINKPSAVPVSSYDDDTNDNSMSFNLPERQEEDFEKLVKQASSGKEETNNYNNKKLPPLGGVASRPMMTPSSLSSSPGLATTNLRQEEEQTTRRTGNPLQLTPLKTEQPLTFDVDDNNTKSLQGEEKEKDFAENSFKLYGEKQESDFIIAASEQQKQKRPQQLLPSSLSESEDVDDIETPLFKPSANTRNINKNDETSTTPPKKILVPSFKPVAVSSPSSSSTTTASSTLSPSSSFPSTTINNNKKAPVPFPTFANIKKVAPKKIVFPPKKTFVLPVKKKTVDDDDDDEDIL